MEKNKEGLLAFQKEESKHRKIVERSFKEELSFLEQQSVADLHNKAVKERFVRWFHSASSFFPIFVLNQKNAELVQSARLKHQAGFQAQKQSDMLNQFRNQEVQKMLQADRDSAEQEQALKKAQKAEEEAQKAEEEAQKGKEEQLQRFNALYADGLKEKDKAYGNTLNDSVEADLWGMIASQSQNKRIDEERLQGRQKRIMMWLSSVKANLANCLDSYRAESSGSSGSVELYGNSEDESALQASRSQGSDQGGPLISLTRNDPYSIHTSTCVLEHYPERRLQSSQSQMDYQQGGQAQWGLPTYQQVMHHQFPGQSDWWW